jgi:hypothetical protein
MKGSMLPQALRAAAVLLAVGASGCGSTAVPSAHATALTSNAGHARATRGLDDGLVRAVSVTDDQGCAYDSNGVPITQTPIVTGSNWGPYTAYTLPANWEAFTANAGPWTNYPDLPKGAGNYILESDWQPFTVSGTPFTFTYQLVEQSGPCYFTGWPVPLPNPFPPPKIKTPIAIIY